MVRMQADDIQDGTKLKDNQSLCLQMWMESHWEQADDWRLETELLCEG